MTTYESENFTCIGRSASISNRGNISVSFRHPLEWYISCDIFYTVRILMYYTKMLLH